VESEASNFLPRAGLAYRLDSKTAIRAGYARYLTPASIQVAIIGELPYPGLFGPNQCGSGDRREAASLLERSFPGYQSAHSVLGKALGRYTNLGGAVTTDVENFRPNLNDRFNVSVQRELVKKIVVDATYFANIGHDLPYTRNFNLMDPQLSYTHKTLLTQRVSNPFYNYLTPATFPGQLRNQAQVTYADLLKPYPQYQSITQTNTPGVKERYHSVQIKAQRPFANGFNFVLAYNYNRERQQEFYNDLEEFANVFRYEPAQRPRQRMTVASVYEFPFGKDRRYLRNTHKLVDHIIGGWAASGIYSYSSGTLLRFGALDVVSDPHIDNPSKWGLIFDPNAFKQLPAFTVRTNPKTIPGIVGPGFKNLDFDLGQVLRADRTLPAGTQDGRLQHQQYLQRRRPVDHVWECELRPRVTAGAGVLRPGVSVQFETPLLIHAQITSRFVPDRSCGSGSESQRRPPHRRPRTGDPVAKPAAPGDQSRAVDERRAHDLGDGPLGHVSQI
jgi:hypothetical protein